MAKRFPLYAGEDRSGRISGRGRVDVPFLILVLLLLTVGLIMLYSASYAQSHYDTGYRISTKYLQKQAVCAAIGLVAMYFFSRIPSGFWYRAAWPLYGLSILLLLSVLVIGQEVNGAKRWISIAGLQFQPSEIAKVTVIIFFAARLSKRNTEKKRKFNKRTASGRLLNFMEKIGLMELLPYIIVLGSVLVLVVMERFLFIMGLRKSLQADFLKRPITEWNFWLQSLD